MSNAMCDVTSHVAHTVSASDCDLGCERYQKGKDANENETSRLCGVFTSRTSEYTHEIKETELEFASSSSSSCLFVFCLSIILFFVIVPPPLLHLLLTMSSDYFGIFCLSVSEKGASIAAASQVHIFLSSFYLFL